MTNQHSALRTNFNSFKRKFKHCFISNIGGGNFVFLVVMLFSITAKAQSPNTFFVKNTTSCPIDVVAVCYYANQLCAGQQFTTIKYTVNPGANLTLTNATATWVGATPSGTIAWDKVKIFCASNSGCTTIGVYGACNYGTGGFQGCAGINTCMKLDNCYGPPIYQCGGTIVNISVISYNVIGGELYVQLQ